MPDSPDPRYEAANVVVTWRAEYDAGGCLHHHWFGRLEGALSGWANAIEYARYEEAKNQAYRRRLLRSGYGLTRR